MHTPAIGVDIFLRYDWIFVKAELILVTKLGVVVAAYTLVIQIETSIINSFQRDGGVDIDAYHINTDIFDS